jgi:tripartite-type tricarboxylate transporter receptor subunit TctC
MCTGARNIAQCSISPIGSPMNLPRRRLLQLMAGAAAVPTFAGIAEAQTYPARPVRWVVGFAAGGLNDILARLIGQFLADRLGQPVVIENRPGAGGNIATEAVANAPADGYTLLLIGSSNTINPSLYDKLPFNFLRDIQGVAGIVRVPLVMEVTPSLPVKSVPEFIAYSKANPGKVNFASGGNGSSLHVAGELFKMMAGVDMVHVPYRGGGPALTDLIGGQVQVMFSNLPESIGYIRAGSLRPLAVTTAARSDALPEMPTVGDFVAGYEASGIGGVGVPKGTPVEVIDKLNGAINAALADPKMKARLAELGGMVLPGSPSDFSALMAQETEKWAKVVKFSGAKAE